MVTMPTTAISTHQGPQGETLEVILEGDQYTTPIHTREGGNGGTGKNHTESLPTHNKTI